MTHETRCTDALAGLKSMGATLVIRDANPEGIWLHPTMPLWIVTYEAITQGPARRGEFFALYESVVPVPAGRFPWTVDNRALGKFSALGEAVAEMSRQRVEKAYRQGVQQRIAGVA